MICLIDSAEDFYNSLSSEDFVDSLFSPAPAPLDYNCTLYYSVHQVDFPCLERPCDSFDDCSECPYAAPVSPPAPASELEALKDELAF